MIVTMRSSSAACGGRISALPSGNRAEVSSTTRTPTLRGTAGLSVSWLSTCRPGPAWRWRRRGPRSRSLAAWSGTAPVSVIELVSNDGDDRRRAAVRQRLVGRAGDRGRRRDASSSRCRARGRAAPRSSSVACAVEPSRGRPCCRRCASSSVRRRRRRRRAIGRRPTASRRRQVPSVAASRPPRWSRRASDRLAAVVVCRACGLTTNHPSQRRARTTAARRSPGSDRATDRLHRHRRSRTCSPSP